MFNETLVKVVTVIITLPNLLALIHLLRNWGVTQGKFIKLLLTFIPVIGAAFYFFLVGRPPRLSDDEILAKRGNSYGSFGTGWDFIKAGFKKKIAEKEKLVARGPLIPPGEWDKMHPPAKSEKVDP